MTIHKEGRTFLTLVLITLVIINVALHYWVPEQESLIFAIGICSVILFILFLQFFRSPKVSINQKDEQVLAPADGKVVVIEEVEENEYLKEKRKQISIFMSPVNVHVNRTPVSGSVSFFRYHPGKYLVAWHPKSSTENERTTVAIKMKNGTEILVRQIAGAVARRIKWYVKEGQELEQGEEFGFIKFGSRVDIFLPLSATINIEIGQKTTAGKTILASL